jgi:DNA-binding NarL/FixJ family response regulator
VTVIDDRVRVPGSGGATVWVFDERRRVRDDVASRLVALPFVARVEVVGEPAALLARLATRLPDVLLVGTQRAVDSGLALATQALRAHPELPVLVLGAAGDAESVRAAVAAGARGYLRWDATPLEMGLGLSRVGLSRDGLPRPLPHPAGALHGHGPGHGPGHAPGHGPVHAQGPAAAWAGTAPLAGVAPTTVRSTVRDVPPVQLSMREMQVLTGMSQGKSNAQIGRELYLSEDTIKTHARRLFRKLGAKDRAEAVASGFRRGMMS